MTTSTALRVVAVGPPVSASGGIGRAMSYVLDALDEQRVSVRVLDTRGLRPNPVSSLPSLLRSCATLLRLGVVRGADVVHVNVSSNGSTLRKGVVVRICRLVRLPVVLHLHASSYPEFFQTLPFWARGWVRRTFGLAERVVVLGEVWRRYVVDALDVPPERVRVLPNATPRSSARAAPRVHDEPVHLLFLGRLGARKGILELLEALADPRMQRRSWRATLAGDGDVEAYRARAAGLGLSDRVAFPGWVDVNAVSALLAEAHALVLPSRAEGMPMAVLEALAAGVPPVCTPVGGLSEVVVDGVNGLLVPVGDARSLADALLRLIDDDELRAGLGEGALDTWQRHHSITDYTARLVGEWEEVASTLRPRGPEQLAPSQG